MGSRCLLLVDVPTCKGKNPPAPPFNLDVRVKFDGRQRIVKKGDCVSFDSLAVGFEPVVFQLVQARWMRRRVTVAERRFVLHDFFLLKDKARIMQGSNRNACAKLPEEHWPSFRLGHLTLHCLVVSLDAMADSSAKSTILHQAVERDDLALVRALVSKPELIRDLICVRNSQGRTAIDESCLQNKYDLALEFFVHFYEFKRTHVLFGSGDPGNQSVLHHAVLGGNGVLAVLIVNCFGHEPDADGRPLKDAADAQGNTPLHLACMHNHPEVVKSLIEVEADCQAKNRAGDTPIMVALRCSHYASICSLFFASAGVACRADVCNLQAETPLYLLARYAYMRPGDATLAKSLLAAGAVPGHTLADGTSCLHVAASRGFSDFCDVILDWHQQRLDAITPADFRGSATAQSFFLPVYRNRAGKTAAELASDHGFEALARKLRLAEARVSRARVDSWGEDSEYRYGP